MKSVIVSGASGFIGKHLVDYLRMQGWDVVRLVRRNPVGSDIFWDPYRQTIQSEKMENAHAIIHLAGENIAGGRWTAARKKTIRDSRVRGTAFLAETAGRLKNPPAVFVCASAIGYYGNAGDRVLDEKSPNGNGFLAEVCAAWENATRPLSEKGVRVVNLRTGMVLSHDGGALPKMIIPFKWGVGGKIGNGSQYVSWIALNDLLRVYEWVVARDSISGPVNAVSPNPVTNTQFTRALGKAFHRPTVCTVPVFMVKLGLGQMGQELLLNGARVYPKKLIDEKFAFQEPFLDHFLKSELK